MCSGDDLVILVLLVVIILQQYQLERKLVATATMVGELIDLQTGKAKRVE